MIKFVIFLSLIVFTSGHTTSKSESSKQKRSIFEDVRLLSPISSYGHGYPWTRSKNLLKVLKIPADLLPTRSIVSYGSAVRPPSPLVVTKHIIVEKQIPVPGKPVIYEKQVPIHVPVHVPVQVPVEKLVPVTVEKSVPVPVPQLLPYPVERAVPIRHGIPYPVPIFITAPQPTSPPQILQLASAPQPNPPPQVLQLAQAPQPTSPPQILQLASAPQSNPPPQVLQLAQAPQPTSPPQILQFASAPQQNPPPQVIQLVQAPQPTLATPTLSHLQSNLARQPSNSRQSILPINFSVNAGFSAGGPTAPQTQDLQSIDLSGLSQLNLLQAPPPPSPLQSNDLGSLESLWAPEEYNDLYSK